MIHPESYRNSNFHEISSQNHSMTRRFSIRFPATFRLQKQFRLNRKSVCFNSKKFPAQRSNITWSKFILTQCDTFNWADKLNFKRIIIFATMSLRLTRNIIQLCSVSSKRILYLFNGSKNIIKQNETFECRNVNNTPSKMKKKNSTPLQRLPTLNLFPHSHL